MSPIPDPAPDLPDDGAAGPEHELSLDEREPLVVRAAVTTAVTAVVHVAVVLGLPISTAAETAIGGAVDAVGLVVILLLVRPRVVPAAKVVARVTTAGDVITGEAARASDVTLDLDGPTANLARDELKAEPIGDDPPVAGLS